MEFNKYMAGLKLELGAVMTEDELMAFLKRTELSLLVGQVILRIKEEEKNGNN